MSVSSGVSPLTMRQVNGAYFLRYREQVELSDYAAIASRYTTNQPQEEYPWLSGTRSPVLWEGERTMRRLRSDKITIVNAEYETGFPIKVKDFIRDKTGQVIAAANDLADVIADWPMELLTALLVANGNAYDGVAYFATTHSVGSSGTTKNTLVTADGLVGGTNPTVAQFADNILLVLAQMLGFKNSDGRPINGAAKEFALMAPPALWPKAVSAIDTAFTSAGATNPIPNLRARGITIVPMVNARLTGTDWFLFRTDAGIRPMIVQEERVAPVELGLDSEHAKKTNEVYFGHGWSGGVGYGRFELACRAQPSI